MSELDDQFGIELSELLGQLNMRWLSEPDRIENLMRIAQAIQKYLEIKNIKQD